jgi:hypothetical protein
VRVVCVCGACTGAGSAIVAVVVVERATSIAGRRVTH